MYFFPLRAFTKTKFFLKFFSCLHTCQNKVFRTRLSSFELGVNMTNKKRCMKTSWTVKKCHSRWNADVPLLPLFSRRCRRPSTATSVWWSPSTWAAVTSCGATAPSCRSSRRLSPQPITAGRRPAAAWRAGRGGCTLRSCSVRWDIYIRDTTVIWLQHLNEKSSETSDLWPLTSELFFFCRSSTRRCTLCCCGSLRPRTNWTPWTSAACRRRAPSWWSTATRWRWEHGSSTGDFFTASFSAQSVMWNDPSAYLFAVSWCWN